MSGGRRRKLFPVVPNGERRRRVRILDMPTWQVFLVRNRVDQGEGYEHVRLPYSLAERLCDAKVITGVPSPVHSHPINAVKLISLDWVQLDGLLDIPDSDLRTHQNMYRKEALNELKVAAARVGAITPPPVQTIPDGPTGRTPAKPPEPENLSRKQVEKLLSKPKPSVRSGIDLGCVLDKATLQLFGGTAIVRDAADSCQFGLRGKLRRAKSPKKEG